VSGKAVFYAIGKLMQIIGIVLFAPLGIALYDNKRLSLMTSLATPEVIGFLISILFCLFAGTIVSFICRSHKDDQGIREGYAIVAFGWIIMALVGAIPFFVYLLRLPGPADFSSVLKAFTDSYFEIMSGFTTTGATILPNVEAVPDALLFWRSLTHWLGGMGIITLAIAIFPTMGVSGYQMFRGEIPGPTADKLRPRLAQTATILWGVYVLLSALETLLLLIGGMPLFDSLCHTFGTMATGGFSTKNSSIGYYSSDFIQWVVVIFMYLAGMNFLLHYTVLRGKWRQALTNREFVFYTGVIVAATLFMTGFLYVGKLKPPEESYRYHYSPQSKTFDEHLAYVKESEKEYQTLYGCFRLAAFQTTSITTTTGYGTGDFSLWPDIGRLTLVVLMFFGGCAGSTGGGMKMIRIIITTKTGWRILRKLTKPKLISPVRLGEQAIDENTVTNIVSYFILFMILFVIGSLLMSLFIPDLVTSATAVAACINNIGPGLNGVGSIEHYGWIPVPGKWILVGLMLLGRLEIFTVLIVLRPSFWK
jgi:trk system potassium uptake protein TrkH